MGGGVTEVTGPRNVRPKIVRDCILERLGKI